MDNLATKVLMIDIETLSLKPNAYVTQVGFCAAVLETREYIVLPTSMLTYGDDVERQPDADIEFDTICWWMKQDKSVADSIFAQSGVTRHHRHAIFAELQRVLRLLGDGATVWASPAMFDLPILTNYFGAKPWKYDVERDMMTLHRVHDPNGELQPPDNTKLHDAAADAHWQMVYLFNLWEKIHH